MSIETSITTEELLAALNAGTFKIVPGRKSQSGDNVYVELNFMVGSQKYRPWIDIQDIAAAKDLADPNEKKPGQDGAYQAKFETRVSLCGELGQALVKLDKIWRAAVDELIAKKTIEQFEAKIRGLVVDKYSMRSKDIEKRGKPIDDPYISFKLCERLNSPKHPVRELKNRQATVLYDFATHQTITDPKTGEVEDVYEEIILDDGKAFCKDNIKLLYKKIDVASVIKIGRIQLDSVVVGPQWISTPITLQTGCIEKKRQNLLKLKPYPGKVAAARVSVDESAAPGVPATPPTGTSDELSVTLGQALASKLSVEDEDYDM